MTDDENRRRIERYLPDTARYTQCLDSAARPAQDGAREDDRDLHVSARRRCAMARLDASEARQICSGQQMQQRPAKFVNVTG
jgi:hypothetical protein